MEPKALSLFGAPQLTYHHTPIHIGRKKALGLLAYLATSDHPFTRGHLATFFWPEYAPGQAYAELRRTLSVLRQTLGDILAVDRETVFIPPDSPLQVDVRIFQNLINVWRGHCHRKNHSCEECFVAVKTAGEIYRDHFLAGFSLGDSGEFDTWQTMQEQTLRNLLGSALEWLAHYHSGQGDLETAIASARRWLSLDTLNEPAHILLMQLLAKDGQRTAAMRQFEECEKVLLTELGLPPQAETIQTIKSILDQQEQQSIGHRASFIFGPDGLPKHNLPFQTIPFVGRERLENDIEQYLQNPGCRLLTLTGPGGSGKSRLAIEVARKHLKAFPDGAYFVRLAECEANAEIVPMIAKVLGFSFSKYKDSGIQSEGVQNVPQKQQLLGYLHDKTILLILDNFEHLLSGVDLLIDLLEAIPHIQLLVTSRIRLNILHEYICPVPGLDLPEGYIPLDVEDADELLKYGAVRFFVQCAQMTTPSFQLKRENIAHVLHICQAMRGMPLGILLATAWLPVLDPQEICTEIDQNFDFLETTLYGLPERQRSMRAVFNHTWKLLSSREQGILQGLSIFRGGFSRQAASVVAGASLPDIKTLASKWLVERDHLGRFILHELLRQYLVEKLDEDPSAKNKLNEKHLMFFTNFLQERSGDLEGNDPKQAVAEIGSEIDNIRAAWNWALDQRNLEAIERSLEGLAKFYILSARYLEGEGAFARASEILTIIRDTQDWDDKNDLLLGKILVQLGLFFGMQGLVCQTRETLQKGLYMLQDSGDRKELGYALLYLGGWQPSIEEQQVFHDKALAIFTELNERKGIAYVHTALGYIPFSQGKFQKARQFFYESLEIHRQLANQRDIASSLGDLGYIHWIMGDYHEALRCFQESLDIMEEQNDKEGIASTFNLLALVFASWKDYAKSKEFIWKRFHVSKETGNLNGIAVSLSNIAECELMEGNDEKAYRLAKESYPYYKKIDERLTNAVWYFRTLGESECGLGLLQEGKMHLRQTLDIQVKQDELAGATHTLVGIARYFEQIGQKERAFELLGLAMYHAESWQWVRERAATLVEKFKQEYPLEVVNTALERGRTLGLEETVTALLDELAEEDGAFPL